MKSKCDHCINKTECKNCDKVWYDKFIPSDEIRDYFHYGYVRVRGINGYMWLFDATNESLRPTHAILIGNTHYCPYCGKEMYAIQDPKTLNIKDYCCICSSARSELEYEEKRRALEAEYKQKQIELQFEYKDKLKFQSNKLLEIKQKKERERIGWASEHIDHFCTLNGEPYTNINQIFD